MAGDILNFVDLKSSPEEDGTKREHERLPSFHTLSCYWRPR
jgi:hypothetical protein